MGARDDAIGLLDHDRTALDPELAALNVVEAHLLEAGARVVRVARQLVFLGEHGFHAGIDLCEYIKLIHVL